MSPHTHSAPGHSQSLASFFAILPGPWGIAVLVLTVTVVRLVGLTGDGTAPVMPSEAALWLVGATPREAWPETGPLLPWLLDGLGRNCGLTTPCLRLAGPLGHGLASWFIYRLGTRLFDARVGVWSAVLYLSAPVIVYEGMIIGPMALLMPAWCLGLHALLRARTVAVPTDWLAIGLAFGLGLLAHPVMALFAPLALIYLATGAGAGRLWRGPGPYIAVLTAVVVLLPVALWNASNDWQGVRDLGSALARALSTAPADPEPVGRLVLLGFLAGGPLVSVALAWVLARLPMEIGRGALADGRVRLLVLFCVPVLPATAVLAWSWEGGIGLTLPALPAALVMVSAWLRVRGLGALLWLALLANVILALLLVRGSDAVTRAGWVLPPQVSVFAPGEGWAAAGRWLDAMARSHSETPIAVAGDDGALMAFYAARHGVDVAVLGRTNAPAGDFVGLLILPQALAEASGQPVMARLTITLPQGEQRRWAAIKTGDKP